MNQTIVGTFRFFFALLKESRLSDHELKAVNFRVLSCFASFCKLG